ncbi:nucleotidyltransferase family protein [Microbacterium sp. BH-3-3-3]|uniref:nucleotidyltransferase family protein n=1 Tax=Microbacterium sp. BH-3-3-3 TaxID=1906742 RepID=UPI0016432EC8|nr:nucleotidyltransferase family protein [Microbacterium sp. BH-3-3-3]
MSSAPPHDERWIPVALGAIDVRGSAGFAPEAEILVIPVVPGPALCLVGEGAALWRELVQHGPVRPNTVDAARNALLEHLREDGLVVRAREHPAAVTHLAAPALSSPLHELVYALVQRVADGAGIRCFFIKGPALHLQGLREREHSGDVDVWCDPARWDDLAEALEPWGWVRQPDPWRGTSIHHTATMTPTSWGCEIDVHRRFPGLTLDDDRAFEMLEELSTTLDLGGTVVSIPQRDAHAVISALHTIRPAVGRRLTPNDHLLAQKTLASAAAAVDAARALGAVAALRADLAVAFPGVDPGPDRGVPRDWFHRAQPDRPRAYLAALRSLPPRERVRAALNLVWPPDDIALASAARAGETTTSAGRARRRRLIRGVFSWIAALHPKERS